METACLRLKFAPLLQKNHKSNSKCCLEIVPEVSCIQNLDKLTWKQETNFIEYTIPMTYKVILKKRQTKQDASDLVVKTYYSCVDLLLSSSKSTVNFGSGDISKIISDTFIFNKSVDNSSSKECMIDSLIEGQTLSNVIRNYPISHKTTSTSFQVIDIELKETEENIKEDNVKVKTNLRQNISANAVIQTVPARSYTKPSCRRMISLSPKCLAKSLTKSDSRRWLSVPPVCSVQETPIVKKILASKAITCKIYDSQKDLVPLGSISSPSDISNENQPINVFSTVIDISGQNSPKKLRFKCRVPPELRVAEYLLYIEKEISPLKMLLDNILSKCTALGVTSIKESPKQSILFKTVSTYSLNPTITKSEEITKSNRVVYTIVFDEKY